MEEINSPAEIPAAPGTNVEESRAKRLERQQARFRDRGGIFVPTKRNDLLDILLGRKIKSPRKSVRGRSRSRSVSCSPVRRAKTNGPGGNTGSLSKKARGKTPRKKSKAPEDDGQPVAGPSSAGSGAKEAASRGKKAKADAQSGVETKAEPKRRGRPPKSSKKTSETSTSVEQDAGTPVAKSKRSRSKRVVVDESEEEDHVAESKPTKQKAPPRASANAKKAVAKPKAKPSKTSAMPVIPEETEEGAQSDDELAVKAVTKNPRSRSKAATADKAKPKAKQKTSIAAHDPDDHIVPPPPPARRARVAKPKASYADFSDDDAEEQPLRSAPKLKPSQKDSVVEMAKEAGGVKGSRKGKEREFGPEALPANDAVVAAKPTKVAKGKGEATKKGEDLGEEDDKAETEGGSKSKPPPKRKPPTKKRPREADTDTPPEVRDPAQEPPKKAKSTAKLDDPEPPRKRSKGGAKLGPEQRNAGKGDKLPAHDDIVVENAPPPKKRARDRDQEPTDEPKRKQVKITPVTVARNEPEEFAPPVKKKSTQKASETSDKPPPTKGLKIASRKLKENAAATKTVKSTAKQASAKIQAAIKGPPKSVLQHLSKSRHHVEDDDPDPIDFLS